MKAVSRFALLLISSMLACAAQAQYPNKPIRLVVPFAAGSATDSIARLVSQALIERLGQPVIVDPKPGASGQIAAEFVAKSAPDGYTLFMTTNTSHSANPAMFKKLPYDPIKDFAPVLLLGEVPFALVVNNAVPVKTTAELIAYAKANPGKLNYGSSGVGSTTHLSGEVLGSMTGTKLVHIAFRGGSLAIVAVLAGDVQMMFANLSDALPQIKSGKLRPLGVTTARRVLQLPELPTIAEAGLPGFDVAPWNGLVAPGKTPPEIVARISDAVQRIAREPSFRDKMFEIGSEPVGDTAEQYRATIRNDIQRWSKIVKEAGIKAD